MITDQQKIFDGLDFLSFTLAHAGNDNTDPRAFDMTSDSATQLASGVLRANGVLLFEPKDVSKLQHNVIISCGVHGNETAPMEIVNRLVTQILSGVLRPKNRILFILGNPLAAEQQERFCESNLNRLFNGRHKEDSLANTVDGKRAALIESEVEHFLSASSLQCLHYDLHTAIRGSHYEKFAVYPFLHDRSWSPSQLAFLEDCGIEAVLLSNQPSSTFSYYTSTQFGAHSFTVELGKVRPFGENDLACFAAIEQQLRGLVEGRQALSTKPQKIKCYSVIAEVIKQTDTLQFTFADDVKNFTPFPRGTVLVKDKSNYVVQHESESVVFPHADVQLGERALLVVHPTSID